MIRGALDGTMARLDIEEAEACEASTMIDAKTALDYLADLPGLWRKTAPERRRNLAEAIFERIEVLGVKEAIITPTPEAEAHGWREAWGDAVLTAHRDGYGRGERSRHDDFDLIAA
ncbi:MAG TPA: hypothetical protein VKI23_00410 [Cellulomonadaceae bacterium]|nr:hypothetical protein [Cellulomonadaceae bacterium]